MSEAMAAPTYSESPAFFGTVFPKIRRPRASHPAGTAFGNLALLAFLVTQCLDGIFTYLGVATFGIEVEANPIIAGVMTHLGYGAGLTSAKLLAATLGICLHVCQVHAAVAVLACLYIVAAVAPWTAILFF